MWGAVAGMVGEGPALSETRPNSSPTVLSPRTVSLQSRLEKAQEELVQLKQAHAATAPGAARERSGASGSRARTNPRAPVRERTSSPERPSQRGALLRNAVESEDAAVARQQRQHVELQQEAQDIAVLQELSRPTSSPRTAPKPRTSAPDRAVGGSGQASSSPRKTPLDLANEEEELLLRMRRRETDLVQVRRLAKFSPDVRGLAGTGSSGGNCNSSNVVAGTSPPAGAGRSSCGNAPGPAAGRSFGNARMGPGGRMASSRSPRKSRAVRIEQQELAKLRMQQENCVRYLRPTFFGWLDHARNSHDFALVQRGVMGDMTLNENAMDRAAARHAVATQASSPPRRPEQAQVRRPEEAGGPAAGSREAGVFLRSAARSSSPARSTSAKAPAGSSRGPPRGPQLAPVVAGTRDGLMERVAQRAAEREAARMAGRAEQSSSGKRMGGPSGGGGGHQRSVHIVPDPTYGERSSADLRNSRDRLPPRAAVPRGPGASSLGRGRGGAGGGTESASQSVADLADHGREVFARRMGGQEEAGKKR